MVQRYITAGIKYSTDDVLQSITAMAYDYTHSNRIEDHETEALHRYLSLLLGYPYAYQPQERPRSHHFLELDTVLPFLYRHREALCSDTGPDSADGPEVLESEADVCKSRLFQCVCCTLAEEPERREYVRALVVTWYDLWRMLQEDPKDSAQQQRLVLSIMEFLLDRFHFRGISPQHVLEQKLKEAQRVLQEWREVFAFAGSFVSFLRQHGPALSGVQQLPDEISQLKPEMPNLQFEDEAEAVVTEADAEDAPSVFDYGEMMEEA